MLNRLRLPALALACWAIAGSQIVITSDTEPAPLSWLWQAPASLESRDLLHGEWHVSHAPDPRAVFTYLRPKEGGANPGVVVRDPSGRVWHVKQAPKGDKGDEGPVEVVLSRVLGAVGYHQPPVYILPSFTMIGPDGDPRLVAGGRFRLQEHSLHDVGTWSWQKNPFVGTQPFNGLLVILLMFNSWDLKDSNNTLYDVRSGNGPEQWYVVRDLGGALGESGHLRPKRNNIDLFERQPFITGITKDRVRFAYDGKEPDFLRRAISVSDVRWAADLMARLTTKQWNDAFLAGGYAPDVANRFIRKLRANITQAQRLP